MSPFIKLFKSNWYLILLRGFLNCFNFLLIVYVRRIWMKVFNSVNIECNFFWFGQFCLPCYFQIWFTSSDVSLYNFSQNLLLSMIKLKIRLDCLALKESHYLFWKKSNQPNKKTPSILRRVPLELKVSSWVFGKIISVELVIVILAYFCNIKKYVLTSKIEFVSLISFYWAFYWAF